MNHLNTFDRTPLGYIQYSTPFLVLDRVAGSAAASAGNDVPKSDTYLQVVVGCLANV